MKSTWKMIVSLVAVLFMCVAAQAQVMSQVPASALVVLHVKNLQDLNGKVASWSKQIGTTDQFPPAADMLGFVLGQAKMDKGFNTGGELALALMNNLQAMNGPNPPLIFLLPVSDYAAFVGNFPGATADGAVTQITLPGGGGSAYLSKWGDYAALTPLKDLLSLTPGGLVMTATAEKEIDSKDVSILVNMPTIRGLVLPLMIGGRQAALQQILNGIHTSPYAKFESVARVSFNQFVDFAQRLITECDDVTYGFSLADDGITSDFVADFKADSKFGTMIAAAPNTDKSMLGGLPEGKYLFMGGSITDTKNDVQMVGDLVDPIIAELAKVGPDGQPFADYLQAIKDAMGACTSRSFGMVTPEGELGASPLFQFIAVANGDSKTLMTAIEKIMQIQTDFTKKMSAGNPMQTTFTQGGKTLGGIVFDQIHQGIDMNAAQNPRLAQVAQILTFIYGQDGLNMYIGPVSDTALLEVGGLSDDKITAAIAAAKGGDDPVAKQQGIINTAKHLPAMREAAFYIPLDMVVNTAFGYVAKFGLDMGVTMPASDPIGITVGTEGSAVRVESYTPQQLVIGVAQVAKKLSGKAQAPPPGGAVAPAPPAGGGL